MKYRLQPKEQPDGTLPYPFFVDDKGLVGRQDFWKGKPYRLLGFNDTPASGDIKLMFSKFKADPQKAVAMYPVFVNKPDDWVTHQWPIESITEKE